MNMHKRYQSNKQIDLMNQKVAKSAVLSFLSKMSATNSRVLYPRTLQAVRVKTQHHKINPANVVIGIHLQAAPLRWRCDLLSAHG